MLVEINQVASINSATEIGLALAATATLVAGDNDLIHKLTQAEVMLI